jgi:DNA repair photolyase
MKEVWYTGSPELAQKKSKSLIHPFAVRGYSGLTINPYQGCHHRCAYCYATYEWSPDFYDKVYSKSNAAEVLEKQLSQWKARTIRPVMVSSATDCYQPAELRFGLTRECIKVLQRYGAPYYVFTKSSLIERDLELHRQYKDNCSIIWSITTVNERVRRVVEPGTPPSKKLFTTIRKFTEAGIRCGVNVDPIMPIITDSDEEIESIVDYCAGAGLDRVFGAILRLRSDIWERMKIVFQLLEIQDAVSKYKKIYRFEEPIGSAYLSANKQYTDTVHSDLASKIRQHGMQNDFPDLPSELVLNKANKGQCTLSHYFC